MNLGFARNLEINLDEIPHAAGNLIHQSARLAEIDILCILSNHCNIYGGHFHIVEKT